MYRKIYEIRRYRGKKQCSLCGRKFTHKFIGHYDPKLFGPYWQEVKGWEEEGWVVAKDYELARNYPVCEHCKCARI